MKTDQWKAHLQYHWWVYPLLAVVVAVFWVSVFDRLSQPSANEQVSITFVGEGADMENLSAMVKTAMPELTDQPVQEVLGEVIFSDNGYLVNQLLAARCLGGTDLIILTESMIFDSIGKTYFLPLDHVPFQDWLGDRTVYMENDTAYGILLYDGENPNRFSSYYEGKERCWLFLTGSSENIAGLNGKGNPADDAALRIAAYLMGVDHVF